MKKFAFFLAAVLLLLLATAVFSKPKAQQEEEEEEVFPDSNVVILDEKNFDEIVGKNEFALVEFYAPWCPHCKELAPKYEKVATALKGKITVAKINCDKNKEVAQKYNIPGFPIVKLFKNGKPFRDFEDERTAERIIAWVTKKIGPSAAPLTTGSVAEFVEQSAISEDNAAVIVGYFPNKESSEYKQFANVSDTLDSFIFGEVVADGQEPHVKLFRTHIGEKDVEFNFKNDGSLQSFITSHGYALVDEVNAKTFARFASANLTLVVGFANFSDKESKQQVVQLLRQVATEYKDKLSFGYNDGALYGEQLDVMGGDKSKLPGIAAMNIEKRKNYPFVGELTEAGLKEWLTGILEGKVEPYLRSEPIPEKNDEPVKVVVGKSFDSIVLDNSKDVLLEFYAPWCGHCKKLDPKFKQLAEFFAPVSNIVIAKIDATLNDTPQTIEGFPTIILYPAGKKSEPVVYDGNRSLVDLKKFLYKNASKDNKKLIKDLIEKDKKGSAASTKQKDEL